MQNRRYEQGGVVSFIVIGSALTLLLVGGVWLAKQQGRVAHDATASPVSEITSPNTGSSAPAEKKTDASIPSTNSGTTELTPRTPAPAPPEAPAQTPPRVATSGPSMVDETLPSTGPADVFVSIVGLSVLGAGTYAYIQSQKRVRASALK